MSFTVPTCECGHATGDHRHVRRSLMAPKDQGGVCLVPGCGCTAFVESVEGQRQAEWLTDTCGPA